MTIEKSARSVREIKRICKISFALHNHFCVVGYKHKSPNVDHNYFFQNNYTILPNEFCNCPCDVPRRLFEMAKSQLADILANLEQQMETNQSDALYVQVFFENGFYKKYSLNNPVVPHIWELLCFNDFTFRRDYKDLFLFDSNYCCDGVNLQEVRKTINKGSIAFSKFYDKRVYHMFAYDDYTDANLEIRSDHFIRITALLFGKECRPERTVEISADGIILKDGGFAYIKALKDHRVRVLFDSYSHNKEYSGKLKRYKTNPGILKQDHMFTADIGGTIRHGDSERMIQIIENQKCVVDNLVRKGALREETERFFMPEIRE